MNNLHRRDRWGQGSRLWACSTLLIHNRSAKRRKVLKLVKAENKHMQLIHSNHAILKEKNVNRRWGVVDSIETYAGIGGFKVPFWY